MKKRSILERAIDLVPGVGGTKRGKRPSPTKAQLAALTRNLEKLVKDVEKLARLIGTGRKKSVRPTTRAARTRNGRKSAEARA